MAQWRILYHSLHLRALLRTVQALSDEQESPLSWLPLLPPTTVPAIPDIRANDCGSGSCHLLQVSSAVRTHPRCRRRLRDFLLGVAGAHLSPLSLCQEQKSIYQLCVRCSELCVDGCPSVRAEWSDHRSPPHLQWLGLSKGRCFAQTSSDFLFLPPLQLTHSLAHKAPLNLSLAPQISRFSGVVCSVPVYLLSHGQAVCGLQLP